VKETLMLAMAESACAPVCATQDPLLLPPAERHRRFGEELDVVKRRVLADIGTKDVTYVKRLNRFSRIMEIAGRALIHVSFEPIAFTVGVAALFVHKQLQAAEIGHTALHGAYDDLPGAERFASKTFRWDVPIDEESWRTGHNIKHHGNTNVAGKDPDIHFGHIHLTDKTEAKPRARWALPFNVAFIFANFGFVMNGHFTGLNDVMMDNGLPTKLDVLPDRSKESVRLAWKRSLRKYVPYYLYNYVLFPALAGPFFWKVLLGNWLAETARDAYSAATIWCGHAGDDVESWPIGTKPGGRGEWYAMQVRAANDFEVPLLVSILCGGLDRQIEHHLFPTLPPPRLRAIAPEVRAICARYAVPYKTDTWGNTLRNAYRHIERLWSRGGGARELLREAA
jgi:NADPH-dependent stearoyl-CoA 9-desaturase